MTSMSEKKRVKLELVAVVDMLLMVEKIIKCGKSHAMVRQCNKSWSWMVLYWIDDSLWFNEKLIK